MRAKAFYEDGSTYEMDLIQGEAPHLQEFDFFLVITRSDGKQLWLAKPNLEAVIIGEVEEE